VTCAHNEIRLRIIGVVNAAEEAPVTVRPSHIQDAAAVKDMRADVALLMKLQSGVVPPPESAEQGQRDDPAPEHPEHEAEDIPEGVMKFT
jgi:hypothetical protein